MRCTEVGGGQAIMYKWLGNMELQDKINTLERGKLLVCIKCGNEFFDKETLEERSLQTCKSRTDRNHACVEKGRYIILKRGFRQVVWWTEYSKAFPPKAAIEAFFKNYLKNILRRQLCR